MITRRQFIEWSAATGAALLARQGWAVEAPTLLPAQPRVQPGFAVPAGACDTHVHILGAADRYPFVAKRAYTSPEASVDQLRALHRNLRQRPCGRRAAEFLRHRQCMHDGCGEEHGPHGARHRRHRRKNAGVRTGVAAA